MALPSATPEMDLSAFLDFLYEETEGYVYTATKDPKNEDWKKYFFQWPQQKQELIQHVQKNTNTYEIYIAPALFRTRGGTKEDWLGSHVIWTEFDGGLPSEENRSCPNPSLRIRSSASSHEHWYWKLKTFETSREVFESYAKRISYGLEGDTSTWNCNRVLRPINTIHHESGRTVGAVSVRNNSTVRYEEFGKLPEPPSAYSNIVVPEDVPDVIEVIAKYKFSQQAYTLFRSKPKDRSTALSQLAHFGAEMGMADNEIMSLLFNADERWEKFKGRRDRLEQLALLIANARQKHPQEDINELPILGVADFVKLDIHLEWAVENFLPKKSLTLFSAPTTVGKTQISLQLGIHLALAKQFMTFNVKNPMRTIFFSLEMSEENLHEYLELMFKDLTDDERQVVNENFLVMYLGQNLYLDRNRDQQRIIKVMEKWKPQGVMIDSMTTSLSDSTNNDEAVNRTFDFLKREVIARNSFAWWLHHFRKAQVGNKKPNTIDDIRGNGVIIQNADHIIAARTVGKDIIRLEPLKKRSKAFESVVVKRTENLNFEEVKGGTNGTNYTATELVEAQNGLADSI